MRKLLAWAIAMTVFVSGIYMGCYEAGVRSRNIAAFITIITAWTVQVFASIIKLKVKGRGPGKWIITSRRAYAAMIVATGSVFVVAADVVPLLIRTPLMTSLPLLAVSVVNSTGLSNSERRELSFGWVFATLFLEASAVAIILPYIERVWR